MGELLAPLETAAERAPKLRGRWGTIWPTLCSGLPTYMHTDDKLLGDIVAALQKP